MYVVYSSQLPERNNFESMNEVLKWLWPQDYQTNAWYVEWVK